MRFPRCIFGANLVNVAQICYKLLHRQIKFPRILSQNVQNDLEGHGQWPLFSISAESITGCMDYANLVIPSEMHDELWCGQGQVYGQTQPMTIPLWPERSRGLKIKITGLLWGNAPMTGWFPHKCPVIQKVFPYHDITMEGDHLSGCLLSYQHGRHWRLAYWHPWLPSVITRQSAWWPLSSDVITKLSGMP